jgi:hypothetical protein
MLLNSFALCSVCILFLSTYLKYPMICSFISNLFGSILSTVGILTLLQMYGHPMQIPCFVYSTGCQIENCFVQALCVICLDIFY